MCNEDNVARYYGCLVCLLPSLCGWAMLSCYPFHKCSFKQEQLEGAGIELPSLYKWIESQAPNGCRTETWKKRTQWVGSRVTDDVTEIIADAEKYLQTHRPVRK